MVLHLKCTEVDRDGYLEMKVGQFVYKIDVVYMRIFERMFLEQSKAVFKSSEDCYQYNAVIALCNNAYIRPSPYIRVIETKAIYKVFRKQAINYFIPITKNSNNNNNNTNSNINKSSSKNKNDIDNK